MDTTFCIYDDIDQILEIDKFGEEYFFNHLDTQKLDSIDQYISKVSAQRINLGNCIFHYLPGCMAEKPSGAAYTNDECKVYWEIINAKFSYNQVINSEKKVAGTLDLKGTTPLMHYVKNEEYAKFFNTPLKYIPRDMIFLFALGLKIPAGDVSKILKKGLLQPDFDPHNPKEAIILYCLNNVHSQITVPPYVKYRELMGYFEQSINNKIYGRMDGTIPLLGEVKGIKSDLEMKEYLKAIKTFQAKSVSKEDVFSSEIKIPNYVYNCKKLGEEEDILTVNAISTEIAKLRKAAYENYLPYQLLPQALLKTIFTEKSRTQYYVISFKGSYLANRLSGKVDISRSDLLISMFLNFTYELEEQLKKQEITKLQYKQKILQFEDTVNKQLRLCRLFPLYFRHPLELFLFRCCLQDGDAFSYFMASWHLALL